jgi:hypothetical protein
METSQPLFCLFFNKSFFKRRLDFGTILSEKLKNRKPKSLITNDLAPRPGPRGGVSA